MALFLPIQCIWNFCAIFILVLHQSSGDQLFNFGLKKDACELECKCYSWRSINTTERYDRFTVNCTGMKFGLFQGLNIPKPLPFNTTDLLVTDYMLGTLSIESFDNNAFPLNPQLISLVLRSCHITYLSHETFHANSLQSVRHVDLSSNTIGKLHEDTFSLLSDAESISVANNYIQKIETNTFRILPRVKVINISRNWLKVFDLDVLYRVPSLEVLNLSHNWLETLPWENMSQLLSLKILGLKGNPWNCSCQMKGILKLNRSLLNGTQAMCQHPLQLNGTLLEDLTSDAFSYCFGTKQTFEITYIIMFLCVILPRLFYYYKFYSKQSETPSKRQVEKPSNTQAEKLSETLLDKPSEIQAEKPSVIMQAEKLPETLLDKPSETQAEKPSVIMQAVKLSEIMQAEKLSETQADTLPGYRCIGQIGYNINNALGPNVYKGELSDGRKAAIKKHDRIIKGCKELTLLLHLTEEARQHPNIIRYLWKEYDTELSCTYIALELCDGDLMTAVTEQIDGFHDIVDPQNYFKQLASGICFLHNEGIQHRDIKPQNILWKRTVDGVTLIISDFDMGHFCKEKSSHQRYGTIGWSAPELYLLEETRSNAVDIFPLGCVFYFILTKGHPFGDISTPEKCQHNIISPAYKVVLDALYERFNHNMHLTAMAEDLIYRMICPNASDRIQDNKIMKHPFLLKREDMKNFLVTIGAYMDDKVDPKVTNFKDQLEENSYKVFDGKWLDKLDKCVRGDLSRYKKEGNDKICCLLRAVRNKIEHFHTLGEAVRDTYLGSEFGVIEYYTKLFPKLVTYTYDVLERSEIENFTF